MRVLLDESVPRDLGFALVGHFVRTVQTMGWAGLSNGKLLAVMLTENFETLITCDQNLEYQQGMDLPVSLIVVVAPNTRVSTVMPLASAILKALDNIQPGEIVHISDARRPT